jgi:hypothetical protein
MDKMGERWREKYYDKCTELVAAEQRIVELESALRGAARYTWIGEVDQPGSCFFCGHARMFHGREGTIAETDNCVQTRLQR